MRKNDAPFVSVIIPIYNSEKYLSECLDTVINQTLKNIEIICIDDGSTDSSLEILKKYQSVDKRIIIQSIEHKNAGEARNKGLDIAKGKCLSFLDSDDTFVLDMLEKMYKEIERNNCVDIVVARAKQFDDNEKKLESINWSIRQELLPSNNPFNISEVEKDVFYAFMGWAWDKMYRKDFVIKNKLRFQSLTKQNDGLFVFGSLFKANKIRVLDECLINHRKHDNSLEKSNNTEKNYMCYYKMLLGIKQQLSDWNIYKQYKQDFVNYAVYFSRVIVNQLNKKNKTDLYKFLKIEGFYKLDVNKTNKTYYYRKSDYNFYIGVLGGKIARVFICLKDNGFRYTIKRALYHFKLIQNNNL